MLSVFAGAMATMHQDPKPTLLVKLLSDPGALSKWYNWTKPSNSSIYGSQISICLDNSICSIANHFFDNFQADFVSEDIAAPIDRVLPGKPIPYKAHNGLPNAQILLRENMEKRDSIDCVKINTLAGLSPPNAKMGAIAAKISSKYFGGIVAGSGV